jgi:hypothetical protein
VIDIYRSLQWRDGSLVTDFTLANSAGNADRLERRQVGNIHVIGVN